MHSNNLSIVINTNLTSEKALTHLVDSIKNDLRYKQYEIIVFIGGCFMTYRTMNLIKLKILHT